MAHLLPDQNVVPLESADSREKYVSRPRLQTRLHDVCSSRVMLVRAPAGYGKSILLLQWLEVLREKDIESAYLVLTPNLRDPLDFLSHLVGAIHAQTTLALPTIRSFLAGESLLSIDLLAKRIAGKLGETSATFFLFLDDVHHLTGSAASACLRMLIEFAPPGLHIVLASRERLDIPLARLKAHGQMCEIAPQELRFLGSEIADLLALSGVHDLPADEFAILDQRSEGWAVGLKLAALSLAAKPNCAALPHILSGGRNDIRDFFIQDVFACQDGELQNFLLKTSVLDRLCAPLCDAITGRKDSCALLDRCERVGLFLFAIDETRTWYRFHPLFREFLARIFNDRFSEECTDLHARASAWFLESKLFVEAIEQALKAKDPICAASILDSRFDAMFSLGQARTVQRLASEIPPHIQAFYPRIMLAAAWPMAVHWKFAEVRGLLTACGAHLADMQRLNATSPSELESMRNLMRHREMMLAQFQDNMAAVDSIGSRLMQNYPDAHPFVAGSICSAYLHGKREHYQLSETDRLDAAARTFLSQCESPQVFIAHEAVVGATRFIMGETDLAIERLRDGLDIAVKLFGPAAPIGAACALPLAEIYFERNELAAARALLEEYLPVATELGFVDQLISGWLTQSRLFRATGNADGALRSLATASTFATRSGFDRLGIFAAEERVRQLLRSGHPDEAARTARQAGLKPSESAPLPVAKVTTRDEVRALLWVSWLEIQNRRAEALSIARQWRNFTAGAGVLRQTLRWDVRIAHLLLLDGEFRGAKRALLRATEIAEPCGFVRSFLDEPSLLDALLPGTGEADSANTFPGQLRTALECDRGRGTVRSYTFETEPAGLSGRLGTQELQVLRLTAGGLTNREVGDRLGMTEGSIKWHLQQIYDKIGVRRRLQAVERARHLGLLN